MTDIDRFATLLFEEAKRFLEKATSSPEPESKEAFLHSALLLGTCALEAHLNAIAQELLLRRGLSVFDKSILAEQDFSLEKGEFTLRPSLKMYRLDDRLQYIFRRFTNRSKVSASLWWPRLKDALKLRNELTHPKAHVSVTDVGVQHALQAILSCLNDLYLGLYKKKYPGQPRRLDSNLSF